MPARELVRRGPEQGVKKAFGGGELRSREAEVVGSDEATEVGGDEGYRRVFAPREACDDALGDV